MDTVAVAAMADSVCGYITNPFDVIKVRVMNKAGEEQRGKFSNGIVGEVAHLVAEDGFAGFFAGAGIRTIWMTLGGIIYWLVLEQTQNLLRNIMNLSPKVA